MLGIYSVLLCALLLFKFLDWTPSICPKSILPPTPACFWPLEANVCVQQLLTRFGQWGVLARSQQEEEVYIGVLFLQLLLRGITAEQPHVSTQSHGSWQVALLDQPALSPGSSHHMLSLPVHTWDDNMAPRHCTLPCGSLNPSHTFGDLMSLYKLFPNYPHSHVPPWLMQFSLQPHKIGTVIVTKYHTKQVILLGRSSCLEAHLPGSKTHTLNHSIIVGCKVAVSLLLSTLLRQNILVCFCYI